MEHPQKNIVNQVIDISNIFILDKINLNVMNFIQNVVYINLKIYKQMDKFDLHQTELKLEYEKYVNNYLERCKQNIYTIFWVGEFLSLDPPIKQYVISHPDHIGLEYGVCNVDFTINLNKTFYDCCKISGKIVHFPKSITKDENIIKKLPFTLKLNKGKLILNRRINNMENKKFILNKENLDSIHFIQHIVYINITNYENFKDKDFTDVKIQQEFQLLCDSYLRLHDNQSIHKWLCCDKESSVPSITDDPLMNKYIIQPSEKHFAYHLLIDLRKPYNECCFIGIQRENQISQFVPINIFNINFELIE